MSLNIPDNKKSAFIEGFKEVARWILALSISWIITETLKQINLVPEFAVVSISVFTYSIPVRLLLNLFLTFLSRFVDKFVHEWNGTKLKGIFPF